MTSDPSIFYEPREISISVRVRVHPSHFDRRARRCSAGLRPSECVRVIPLPNLQVVLNHLIMYVGIFSTFRPDKAVHEVCLIDTTAYCRGRHQVDWKPCVFIMHAIEKDLHLNVHCLFCMHGQPLALQHESLVAWLSATKARRLNNDQQRQSGP